MFDIFISHPLFFREGPTKRFHSFAMVKKTFLQGQFCNSLLLLLLLTVFKSSSSFSFNHDVGINKRITSTNLFSSMMTNDAVRAALVKPSKTMSTIFEVSSNIDDEGDLSYLSLQMRKNKVNALSSQSINTVRILVEEQSSASGNFPGPCPVFYDSTSETGNYISKAIELGVSGIIADFSLSSTIHDIPNEGGKPIQWVWKCSTVEAVQTVLRNRADEISNDAFLFSIVSNHDDLQKLEDIETCIEEMTSHIQDAENTKNMLLIGEVYSMMRADEDTDDTSCREIQIARAFKKLKFQSVLVMDACVGDSEDLEYAKYFLGEVTSKSSKTFKMTGLTGSANGHFGGVQSQSKGQNWKRRT